MENNILETNGISSEMILLLILEEFKQMRNDLNQNFTKTNDKLDGIIQAISTSHPSKAKHIKKTLTPERNVFQSSFLDKPDTNGIPCTSPNISELMSSLINENVSLNENPNSVSQELCLYEPVIKQEPLDKSASLADDNDPTNRNEMNKDMHMLSALSLVRNTKKMVRKKKSSSVSYSIIPHIKCQWCAKQFACRNKLKKHRIHVHGEESNFSCPSCHKYFYTHYYLNRHVCRLKNNKLRKGAIAIMPQSSIEKEIKSITGNSENLSDNDISESTEIDGMSVSPFHCKECSSNFLTMHELRLHCVNHHCTTSIVISKFVCKVCDLSCDNKASLTLHMESHKKTSYKCLNCAKTFTTKANLERHMVTHTKEKLYQCSFCFKSFSRQDNYMSHVRRCTK